MANINSFNFDGIHSVIIAKLETSCSQTYVIIQYKIDTDSDGNIVPYHIFSILFPREIMSSWWQQKQEHHSKKIKYKNNSALRYL